MSELSNLVIHASRSRYEAFNRCMRFGFIQYHWGGRGIVRKGKNIYLSTGIWTHKGLELILKWCKQHENKMIEEYILDHFIDLIKKEYFSYVFPEKEIATGTCVGFDLVEVGVDEWDGGEKRNFTDIEKQRMQQYTFNEQSALVEALLRVFVLRVLPDWLAKYKIVTVENDMAFPLVDEGSYKIIQSATIDVVLQEIGSKDLYVVSFKTASQYNDKVAKQASHDTQGLSETWAFEEYLRQKGHAKSVMGVLMLYLVKGQRRETKRGSGEYRQQSPLIRGYKRAGELELEYAHSWYYPNPQNASGVGALGKSWDSFDVWDNFEIGGVKGWIKLLEQGQIQPDCGDVLGEQVVAPIPFERAREFVDSWLRQTKAREADIAKRLFSIDYYISKKLGIRRYMDEQFPQNNASCHGMYGADCPYLSMCWGTAEERWQPLENGFVNRTPHHRAELIQLGLGEDK